MSYETKRFEGGRVNGKEPGHLRGVMDLHLRPSNKHNIERRRGNGTGAKVR